MSVAARRMIALVGAPNCGKTTLYNWLTGSKFRTVNYPGATVEYSLGHLEAKLGNDFELMDTPGTYSLHPKSADEEVTRRALFEEGRQGNPQGVIVVVDGTQISRHLILADQIRESGFPMLIVITMDDLLKKQVLEMDAKVLSKSMKCRVVLFDGVTGRGLAEIVAAMRELEFTSPPPRLPPVWSPELSSSKSQEFEAIGQKALFKVDQDRLRLKNVFRATERIDRFLLHPIWGLFLFFLIMGTLFSGIYWLATPLMDAIDTAITWVGQFVYNLAPGTFWADFLSHGLIASFSAVLVFVPQIFILFWGIGILEGTGYLARAATLIDRPFQKLGLSGRSFVPVLSGFACAVPALMATRNIPSGRDRWITNFMIPLMSCSARLPVYALLLGFLFQEEGSSWKAGFSLAGLYFGSLLLGFIAAAVLNRMIPKGKGSFFMMELPLYRRPRWATVFHQALSRTKSFVVKAGPIIFIMAVILWTGTTFPNYQASDEREKVQTSYIGQLGLAMEPAFEPMGVDWRVGVGLLSAFAAREVFVSSMAVVFQVASEDEGSQQRNLLDIMGSAVNSKGQKIFTVSSVLGLIVFFMIALQCMSTVGMAYQETKSWKFALGQLASFNIIAYILSVGLVQGLRALGVA